MLATVGETHVGAVQVVREFTVRTIRKLAWAEKPMTLPSRLISGGVHVCVINTRVCSLGKPSNHNIECHDKNIIGPLPLSSAIR